MIKQEVVIIGDGGHSQVIQDIIYASPYKYEIVGILDDKYKKVINDNGKIYGPVHFALSLFGDNSSIKFIIAIGNNEIRKKIFNELRIPLVNYPILIHPSSVIGSNVELGNGTVVMPNTTINAGTKIGNHSIINTGSVVEHDNIIESYVHISPMVGLAGSVKVKEGTHLGIGAKAIPKVEIGSWTTVGAGSVIINSLPDNCTAVGIPAIPIKYHNN